MHPLARLVSISFVLVAALPIRPASAEPPAAPPAPTAPVAKVPHESDLPIPGVTNSGDQTSAVVETVIDAPLAKVWSVFSTPEGFKTLGVAQCEMDFRVGGLIRSHYSASGVLGDPGTIVNQIIAFEPERMVSFRIQQAPAKFPFPNACKSTWSVATLEPDGPERTRLRLAMLGYTPDEESQKMRDFFARGNAWTLKHLKEKLDTADARARADKAWGIITGMVGDAWRGCASLDSKKLCANTTWTYGPENKSVLYVIRLGPDEATQHPHVQMVLAREAPTGAVVFTAVNNQGEVMRGHATLVGDAALSLDCHLLGADGAPDLRVVTYTPGEDGAYVQRNYDSAANAAAGKPWVELSFSRAPRSPGAPVEKTPMLNASPPTASPIDRSAISVPRPSNSEPRSFNSEPRP